MSTPLHSARALLQAEASALAELATRLDGAFTQTVDLIAAHPGKVVLCGVGKSGLIGQKVAATLCSTGTPAIFLHAADAVHGDLGILQAGDPVVLISRSGTTAELATRNRPSRPRPTSSSTSAPVPKPIRSASCRRRARS
jgi:arabinose-5-phosphate isomerase